MILLKGGFVNNIWIASEFYTCLTVCMPTSVSLIQFFPSSVHVREGFIDFVHVIVDACRQTLPIEFLLALICAGSEWAGT